MTRRSTGLAVLLAAFCAWSSRAAEKTTTERFAFPSGGLIRIENSYGYLTVEGWDEPEVEVTITKTSEESESVFDQVPVAIKRTSDRELEIVTSLPLRTSLLTSRLPSGHTILTSPLPPNTKRGVIVEYRVRAPRTLRLIVHHDNGYVWVSDLTGDLEVHSHTGDMIISLPEPGPYRIDAKTGLGRIVSDLEGKRGNPLIAGGRLRCAAPDSFQKVHLRMGRGSISIQNSPPIRVHVQ